MAKTLTHTEFIRKWSEATGLGERTLKKAYEKMEKIVKDEVTNTGEFRFKNIGLIYTKNYGGFDMNVPALAAKGKKDKVFVDERRVPKMKFSGNFRDYVAGQIVSREAKKRIKKGEPSSQDKMILELPKLKAQESIEALIANKAQTGEPITDIIKQRKKDK